MQQYSKDLGRVSVVAEGAWNGNKEYDKLSIVYNKCDKFAYVSRKKVPVGVDIDNREYWQPLNVNGYADNNFINLTTTDENDKITAYNNIVEAATSVSVYNRRVGAVLSFYNINSDSLDRQPEFELWQFNSLNVNDWTKESAWQNIYYNWNIFVGWYVGLDALKNHVPEPTVGQYAYVGSTLNDALLYQCRTNKVWFNTNTKVRNFISVKVEGNITIGANGHWYSNGNDTGIPATPTVDEEIDSIVSQIKTINSTTDKLHNEDVRIEEKVDNNNETLDKKIDNVNETLDKKIDDTKSNLQSQISSNDTDIANLNTKHDSLKTTVDSIAVTGGASVAKSVTFDDTKSSLNATNVQDAIDNLQYNSNKKIAKLYCSTDIKYFNNYPEFRFINVNGVNNDKLNFSYCVTYYIPTYITKSNIRYNLTFNISKDIKIDNLIAIAAYDKNFNFLKDKSLNSITKNTNFSFDDSVFYIRVSCYNINNDKPLINIKYNSYYFFDDVCYNNNIDEYTVSCDYKFVLYNLSHYGYINKSNVIVNFNIDINHRISNYIYVNLKLNKSITISGVMSSNPNSNAIVCYDYDKNIISDYIYSSLNGDLILDDENIAYIRLCFIDYNSNNLSQYVSIKTAKNKYLFNNLDGIINIKYNIDNDNDDDKFVVNDVLINNDENIKITKLNNIGYISINGYVNNDSDLMWINSDFILVKKGYFSHTNSLSFKINYIYKDPNICNIAAYDKDFNFLKDESIINTDITEYIPRDNVMYVRFSSSVNIDIDVIFNNNNNFKYFNENLYNLNKISELTDLVNKYIVNNKNNFLDKQIIICDGDSLTYGDLGINENNNIAENKYPVVLQNLLGDVYKVLDYGVPGFTSSSITGIATGFLITKIYSNEKNNILLQTRMIRNTEPTAWSTTPGGSHHNSGVIQYPYYLNGIVGQATYVKPTGYNEYVTKFTPDDNSINSINVKVGDVLFTSQINYSDATHIIFMGANGGYVLKDKDANSNESINELIGQYKNIIAKSNDLYICISNYTFTLNSGIWKGESMFDEAFGKHHLNLRKYLVENGISDALNKGYLINGDITYPTSNDITRINNNCIPLSLLSSDKFHLNDVGYHLLGDLVYEKYIELYKEKILGTL